jgi:hypothetical protein
MKQFLKIILLSFSVFIGNSCTKKLDIKIDSQSDRVVIEGHVTNEVKPFIVKLSKTLALQDSNQYPTINNAFVTIGDDAGHLDTLINTSDGVYQTNGIRQGIVGRTYYLTVKVDGQTYQALDKLFAVSPIDSLYTVFLEAGSGLGIREDGYYAFFNSTDPPQEKNYYKLDVYRNDSSVLKSNQLDVSDDRFLAPVVKGSRLPGKFKVGDKLVFNLSSLSEAAYNYYNGVSLQLQNDGGFFSTPPANAVNNLSDGALGFFQASSVASDSLIVTQ